MGKKKRALKAIAFSAYPSRPESATEAHREAAKKLTLTHSVRVLTWEQCRVGGKVIIQEICRTIQHTPVFMADVTTLNPNVLFELGFAIAKRRRLWLLLDESMLDSKRNFETFYLLTGIGYRHYCNSDDIVSALMREQPWRDLKAAIPLRATRSGRGPAGKLLYLKSRVDTEPSVAITRALAEANLPLIVDDPQESPVQAFSWYTSQVEDASAVLCHFTPPDRDGAQLFNARHAFVAGMAHGLEKRLLLLAEGNYLAPLDYRELLVNYRNSSEAIQRLRPWLDGTVRAYLSHRRREPHPSERREAVRLAQLRIGDPLAENEEEQLVDDYFVPTAAYNQVLEPKITVFVGRKGSGKTANLLKAAAELQADKRNLVCVIKPPSYELEALIRVFSAISDRDSKGYAIESLWKYIIYSEMAGALHNRIQERLARQVRPAEETLEVLIGRDGENLLQPFSIRLEKAAHRVLDAVVRSSTEDIEGFRLAVSESLHRGPLHEIREAVSSAFSGEGQITILIDNLDKSWDRQSDLAAAGAVLLGLLSAVHRIQDEFRSARNRKDRIPLGVCIFLRTDILTFIRSGAREPDKIAFSHVAWDDPHALVRVIEERFCAASGRRLSAAESWETYFCDKVAGLAPREYFMKRCLPRPRDLVYFAKAAFGKAIDRNHERVEAEDIIVAERDYSFFALQTALVEAQLRVPCAEDLFLDRLAGGPAVISEDSLFNSLAGFGVGSEEADAIRDELMYIGFLGLEVNRNDYRFIDDETQLRKIQALARRYSKEYKTPIAYEIHPAFRAYLEIREDG